MTRLRPELPPLPAQLAHLYVDRGYPVPWFVAWMDENENELPDGQGRPDFRVMSHRKLMLAIRESRCWVCGDVLPGTMSVAFLAGPMCAVNRTSAEPPSHIVCADWSARACPFLTRPHARRRDAALPRAGQEPAGIFLRRNPGVAMVWITRPPVEARKVPNGILFDLGEPARVRWYAEGREATREEVMDSIESGYPLLLDVAEDEGDEAVDELNRMLDVAKELVPA